MAFNATMQCVMNLTDTEQQQFHKRENKMEFDFVHQLYFGWIPLPLAITGFILTSIYIFTIYHGIIKKQVSRKCYFLLLNKSIGDVLCSLSAIVTAIYVLSSKNISKDVMAILETFFIAGFWSATVSFVSISIIKLYAVWKPFEYKQRFTMRRCIKLIIFCWIVFCIMAFITILVNAMAKVPVLKEWSGCKIETCLKTMYRVRNSFVILLYAITIVTYIITVFLVLRIFRSARSFQQKAANDQWSQKIRFPLWKLSLNVGTFAFLNIFYVLWSINILVQQNHCSFLLHFSEMIRILGIIRAAILLRTMLDPIIGFTIDTRLRRKILYWSGLRSKSVDISPKGSRKIASSDRLSRTYLEQQYGGVAVY